MLFFVFTYTYQTTLNECRIWTAGTTEKLIHNYQLKKMLQLRLGDDICISSFGNRDAVHSINIDPLLYSHDYPRTWLA